MIDWNKRCKELKALMDEHGIKILASGWFRHQIIFQEQSMLEIDKAELVNMLKVAKDQSCGCIDHYLTDMEELIQKMEK